MSDKEKVAELERRSSSLGAIKRLLEIVKYNHALLMQFSDYYPSELSKDIQEIESYAQEERQRLNSDEFTLPYMREMERMEKEEANE